MDMHELKPEAVSHLTYKYSKVVCEHEGKSFDFLCISFDGIYGGTASVKDDTAFMEGIIAQAVYIWPTECLVIDLARLEYEWGNSIVRMLNPVETFLQDGIMSCVIVTPAVGKKAFGDMMRASEYRSIPLADSIEQVVAQFARP